MGTIDLTGGEDDNGRNWAVMKMPPHGTLTCDTCAGYIPADDPYLEQRARGTVAAVCMPCVEGILEALDPGRELRAENPGGEPDPILAVFEPVTSRDGEALYLEGTGGARYFSNTGNLPETFERLYRKVRTPEVGEER